MLSQLNAGVRPATKPRDMDSLDVVELIMEFEGRFGVDLPNVIGSGPFTVGDLWRAVVRHRTGVEPPAGPPPALDPTWREVVVFVAKHTQIPADDVRWDASVLGERKG